MAVATDSTPRTEPGATRARWERICRRFEDLIESWVGDTVSIPDRDWTHQLAGMALAAQRVAALRAVLTETQTNPEDERGEDETDRALERRHWEALLRDETTTPGPEPR